MTRPLFVILGVSALLGAIDRAAGNRLGLGQHFEAGFRTLGPLGLSMAGILCLSPLLAACCRPLSPLLARLGTDPALPACLLAIDMGGWQIGEALAENAASARFFGILASATLGCTLSFTIPTGMGLYNEKDRGLFSRGLLYGLVTIPFGLFAGALCMGISLPAAFRLCLPLILFSALLGIALARHPAETARALRGYASFLRVLATLGLGIAAFSHLSGIALLPGMMPLPEAMEVVSSIGITLLGGLTLSEILLRGLSRCAGALGRRIGLSARGLVGLLLLYMSISAGLAAIPDMEDRDKVVAAAFSAAAASCLTSHLAFTARFSPETAGALILCKTLAAFAAAALAVAATKNKASA